MTPTQQPPQQGAASPSTSARSEQMSGLIQFAQSNYETNPTQALSALMDALTIQGGPESANRAIERIRTELGPLELMTNHTDRRALQIIQEIVQDTSTLLHQRGKQHVLQQAMQDGSSVVCTKCNGMVAATRWQQHANYWCPAIVEQPDNSNQKGNNEEEMDLV